MALGVTQALAVTQLGEGHTSFSWTLTPPGDAVALLVTVAGTHDELAGVTYGGVAMTVVQDIAATRRLVLYELLDLSGASGTSLAISKLWYVGVAVEAAWLTETAPAIRLDSDEVSGAIPGNTSLTLDPGSKDDAVAYLMGMGWRSGGVNTSDISSLSGAGQTQLSEGNVPSGGFHDPGVHAAYKADVDAAQSFGVAIAGSIGDSLLVAALYGTGTAEVEVEPPAASAGIPHGFVVGFGAPIGAIYAHPFGIAAAAAGIPTGFSVSAEGPAEVLLNVVGRDRPQLTEGGGEGYVLTKHVARKPSWEPAGIANSLVIDTATGTYDIDAAIALTHEITLTGATALTPVGTSAADEAIDLRLVLFPEEEDVTWGGTILWEGGSAPDLSGLGTGESVVIGFLSTDTGATWRGFLADASSGAGTPATTVEDETTWGISPAVGTDTEYARQDHTHGTPTLDWGEDGDISTLDYDDVADAGVLDEFARADHVHGMPSAAAGSDPGDDTHVWMPLTTVIDGDPELVWDEPSLSLIPTLVAI